MTASTCSIAIRDIATGLPHCRHVCHVDTQVGAAEALTYVPGAAAAGAAYAFGNRDSDWED